MNEEIVITYLDDDNFSLAKEWYEYTLKPDWDFVVFIVRRAYLVAQIVSQIIRKKMEEESKALFLTDAAILSRSRELALFYLQHHRLPNILICEDCLVHGRNINFFLIKLCNEIWEELEKLDPEADEEAFRNEFTRAIKIHVIVKPDEGLVLLERYMLKVHSCAQKTVKELHDFSHEISNLISHSGKANVSYIYTDVVGALLEEKIENKRPEGHLYRTKYHNIEEISNIKFIKCGSQVKGIMTLRMLDMFDGRRRVLPFAFLPDLSQTETQCLWDNIKEKLQNYTRSDETLDKYIRYMEYVESLKNKRSFDEWLTLILSLMLMGNVYAQLDVDIPEETLEDYEIIGRNYNISNLNETEEYLKYLRRIILEMAVSQRIDIDHLILDSLEKENYITEANEDSSGRMQEKDIVNSLEQYWETIAAEEEERARLIAGNPVFYSERKKLRHTHNCGEMINELFNGRSQEEMGLGIAYILQMMDRGMISVSSYGSGEESTKGFIQRAKAGEMSLLIYPSKMKEYIPLLAKIYNYCEKRGLEWWKIANDYCNSSYSRMSQEECQSVEKFVKYLYYYDQNPDEWDIYYGNDVINNKDTETQRINRKLELVFNSYGYWSGFERYVKEVLMK